MLGFLRRRRPAIPEPRSVPSSRVGAARGDAADWTPGALSTQDAARVLRDARDLAGPGPWRETWRRLRARRAARWAMRFLGVVLLASLLAPLLPLPSPVALDLREVPGAPVWPWKQLGGEGFEPRYWRLGAVDAALVEARTSLFGEWQTGPWLGTDSKGRDQLSRLVWGSRTSILVALAATATSLLIGVAWGAVSGYVGGRTDELMMRAVDALQSLPFVFAVIFVLAILNRPSEELGGGGPDSMVVLFVLIGAVYWLSMARVVRGQVLALRSAEFVAAARAVGASGARIVFRHLVPNVLSVVIVHLTLSIPSILLLEAFLSFLGLGVQPPRVSWGLLAADGTAALNPLRSFWWLVTFPALAMGSTLLALNLLGDELRDALDPTRRGAAPAGRPGPRSGAHEDPA